MVGNVVVLDVHEDPHVHQSAIKVLQESLGVEPSRAVVEAAVFEISDRLCRLEFAYHEGRAADVGKIAGSLVGISSQIGLLVLAQVAQGLSQAVQDGDTVVTAALAARLLRLGESSLFCAVELADRSG